MRKITLFIFALLCSAAAFAIAPIVGSTSTCVGGTASLSDATPAGMWSSSNPAIATVGAGTGIVNGIAVGSATITYAVGTSFVTTPFTVNPATTVSGPATICVGNTLMLSGAPSGGSWTSGTPTLATVSSSGLVTGTAPGVVNIYYTAGGCYAYRMMTVNPMPSPVTGTTTFGTSSVSTLSCATPGGSWSSSNTAIATVGSSSGICAGIAAGSCNITYSVGGCYSYATVTVTTSISAIMGSSSVCAGSTTPFTCTTPGGAWSSSNTAVATVHTGTGLVSGIAAGVATITYTVGTAFVTKVITVNPLPVIAGGSSVCVGSSITLSATPAGGAWSSGGPAIATVGSSSGIVTSITAGTVSITYTTPAGCSAYRSVTSNTTPAISGSSAVCAGAAVMLSASVTGGAWSSSNPSAATVSSSGAVTGVAAGLVTITYATPAGCYAYRPMTVNPSPVISGSSFVCEGAITILSGSPSGGSWSSSSSWTATVDSAGNVSGMHAGVVAITYSYGGCSATRTITVNAAPVISGPSSVCEGSSITLAASPSGGSWTSGSPTVATVSSAGVVTALTSGVINIYYTAFGCYTYKTISVNASPAAIGGPTSVSVGGSVTLTDATPGGVWTSSNPAVAAVGSSSGIVSGISLGSCNITYTVGSCYVYTYFSVATSTIAPIMGSSTVCVGSSTTLTDATPGGSWSSSNPSVAAIHPFTGVVTGMAAGTAIITYSIGPAYVTRSITVIASAFVSGTTVVCIGSSITLSGSPTGGTWSTASFSASVGSSSGVVTGLSTGTATITYAYSGCSALHTVTVSPVPFISGSGTVCAGSSVTLAATPSGGSWTSGSPSVATVSSFGVVTGVSSGVVNIYYTSGSCYAFKSVTVNTLPAITGVTSVVPGATAALSNAVPGGTWSSSNPAIASVGSSSGIVVGVAIGSCNITYSLGGCFVYVPFTVSAVTIAPIMGSTTICVGSSTTLTDATPGGVWSSSNPSIASVHPGSGLVTGISAGTAIITYTVGPAYVITSFTVLSSASISGSGTACAGATVALTASPSGGSWSTSAPSIATVSSSGIVTGMMPGVVTISYVYSGCSATKMVTVTSAPSITGSSTVCAGSSVVLAATPFGGSWTSGAPTVATVSTTGLVTGVTPGVVNIYYTAGGCYSFKPVTVTVVPVISGSSIICIGTPVTLSGSPSGGTWSNGGSWNATVGSSSGIVTGLSTGPLTITYTQGSCSAYRPVTVSSAPLITGSGPVCVLASVTLSAGSGGLWSSSNTAIATVSGGIVTGVSAGVATISYAQSGCYSVRPVTVNPAPAPVTGPSSVFPGLHITLSCATPGGTWASDNPSIASVGPTTGIVTGVFFGTTNIHYWAGGCSSHKAVTVTLFPSGTEGSSTHSVPGISGSGKVGAEVEAAVEATGIVRLYPNPASGSVNILWEGLSVGDAEIVITDMTGRRVQSGVLSIAETSGQAPFNLASLADGIYIVTIRAGATSYTGKLQVRN